MEILRTSRVEPLDELIMFSENDTKKLDGPHDGALVLTLDVLGCEVSRILMENKSFVDVIFRDTLLRIGIDQSEFGTSDIELTGFNRKTPSIVGSIKLSV